MRPLQFSESFFVHPAQGGRGAAGERHRTFELGNAHTQTRHLVAVLVGGGVDFGSMELGEAFK
jgi:hypothetical protein